MNTDLGRDGAADALDPAKTKEGHSTAVPKPAQLWGTQLLWGAIIPDLEDMEDLIGSAMHTIQRVL